MLKNYFLIALRNLLRYKSYAAINIVGLAIGVAACLLIFIVVAFETSFDTFHNNSQHIYRVSSEFNSPEGKSYSAGSPDPVAGAMRIDFPQLKNVAAIRGSRDILITIPVENNSLPAKKFKEASGVFFAEPSFFDIFYFPWLAGDPKTALSEPNTAVLTKETAERYFGNWQAAIGKTFLRNNKTGIRVTGILADVPPNTDFPLKVVVSYETFKKLTPNNLTDWVTTSSNAECFVVLSDNESPAAFNTGLTAFVKKHKPAEYTKDNLVLQRLHDIHFDERFYNFQQRTFSRELIKTLTLIGIFLLVIACVNFVNLATAQAVNRAKEVAVRKVLGSGRRQLMLQFIGETGLITLSAVVLAIAIAILALPALGKLLNVPLAFPWPCSMRLKQR